MRVYPQHSVDDILVCPMPFWRHFGMCILMYLTPCWRHVDDMLPNFCRKSIEHPSKFCIYRKAIDRNLSKIYQTYTEHLTTIDRTYMDLGWTLGISGWILGGSWVDLGWILVGSRVDFEWILGEYWVYRGG